MTRSTYNRCMDKGSIADGLVYHAGFPNAAEDQVGQGLSLDSVVFRHRASTYLWQLEDAISELGWTAGSIVVVDRSLQPRRGDIVVAVVDGRFAVRKFYTDHLSSLDGVADDGEDISVWGVVTHALQKYRSI